MASYKQNIKYNLKKPQEKKKLDIQNRYSDLTLSIIEGIKCYDFQYMYMKASRIICLYNYHNLLTPILKVFPCFMLY